MFDLTFPDNPNSTTDPTRPPFVTILAVIDVFSRFLWAAPLRSKHASNVVGFIATVLDKENLRPQYWHCDNGREFKNELMTELMVVNAGSADAAARYRSGEPYNPCPQGAVRYTNDCICCA